MNSKIEVKLGHLLEICPKLKKDDDKVIAKDERSSNC
jgi:hypothetical protein